MAEDNQTSALHFLDYWRVIRDRKEVILAVALLTIVTGTAYTVMMPKKYTAVTQLEVREDAMDVDPFYDRQVARMGYNPFFLMTQEKIMRSRPVLMEVIRRLNLQRVWGAELNEDKSPITPDLALQILSRSLRVEQDRDTVLMNIRVTTENDKRSAEIANEVANVYRDRRLNAKRREIQRAIDAISNEVRKQQERVEEAEAELQRIREERGISLIGHMGSGTGIRVEATRLNMLESERSAARVEMLVRKARLEQLENLKGTELMEAAAYIVQDSTLMAIRQQLIDSEVSLQLMLNTGVVGENHPDVLRLKGAVDELHRQLHSALEGLKAGLRADYEVALQKYNALDEELQAIKEIDIESEGTDYLPFYRAERNVQVQRDILTALRARVTQTGIEVEVPRTTVDIIEEAEPPQRPSSPLVVLNIFLSVVLGLLAGVGLAFFVEYLDVSIKTVDEVEKYLGLPVLAVIPQQSRPLTEAGQSSGQGEAYRSLRTSLALLAREGNQKIFAVLSGGVGEGKSTTLFNLAYVCAEQGSKVLIIDSDLRRPVQHKMVGLPNRVGMVNVLTGEMKPEDVVQETGVPNLWMMTSGRLRRGSMGIMNSPRLRAALDEVKDQYDYILLDSPPILGVTDAAILAGEVDGVLLVVQYRKYPKIISLRAKRMIENAGGHLMGSVLNNINIMRDDYYYYYHYTTKKYYGSTKHEHDDDATEV
ncbi:MAG: polysaccharide biosynthesis tyrosine autokinase [Kiritimatiellae bacterium]|nr:polysaccharide biosynthesis tyrosine autokinase [Kiritimatiellia bacterium]MDD4342137.1 polysaccharide biosynthesis tyrosine autokinase [Kiritimatiellia bacterium]